LFEVLSTQSAGGWFAITPAVENLVSVAEERAREVLAKLGSPVERDYVVATLRVLALLRGYYAGQQRLWRRHYDKAVRYVCSQLNIDAARVEQAIGELL